MADSGASGFVAGPGPGSAPPPVPGSAPAAVPGSAPAADSGSAPAAVPGSASAADSGSAPAAVPGSASAADSGSAPAPDPRSKIIGFAAGMILLVVVLSFAQFHSWAIAYAPSTKRRNSLVTVHHLESVWILICAVAVTSVICAIGWQGVWNLLCGLLDGIRRLWPIGDDRFKNFIQGMRDRVWTTKNRLIRYVCSALSLACLALFSLLVIYTGGLVVSPFVQIAVTGFVWQVFLSAELRTRILVGVEALLFLIVVGVCPPDQVPASQQYQLHFIVLVTSLNVVFVIIPLVFKNEERASSAQR